MKKGKGYIFKKAVAIPMVIFLLVVALIFGGGLFKQGQAINVVNEKLYAQKYLEWLNRGILELVKYKLKVLPSEFYIAHWEYTSKKYDLEKAALLKAFLLDFNKYKDIEKLDPDQELKRDIKTTRFDFRDGKEPLKLELKSIKDSNYYEEDIYKVTFKTSYKKQTREMVGVISFKRIATD
ncbi:hypothetical protein ACFL35_02930 [Candidatus Riflebacteria bacterium]